MPTALTAVLFGFGETAAQLAAPNSLATRNIVRRTLDRHGIEDRPILRRGRWSLRSDRGAARIARRAAIAGMVGAGEM